MDKLHRQILPRFHPSIVVVGGKKGGIDKQTWARILVESLSEMELQSNSAECDRINLNENWR